MASSLHTFHTAALAHDVFQLSMLCIALSLAPGLALEVQEFVVLWRQEQGRLRAAAKAVAALGLEQRFPEAEFQWKEQAGCDEALRGAVRPWRRPLRKAGGRPWSA